MGSQIGGGARDLALDYSDNERSRVADRLRAEIEDDSTRLDVATGYLTPSVWGVLGASLRKLKRFRLLLGRDFELDARRPRREVEQEIEGLVQDALRADLEATPLPTAEEAADVAGWLGFLARSDEEVDVRVWPEGFLHAKAYLLEGSAGVGSANFTAGGLMHNRELVSWRQDRPVVRALRDWFERHWEKSAPYKQELIRILERSRFGPQEWTPFELLIRVLYERYGVEDRKPLDSERLQLYWYQEDAIWRLVRLLYGPARGALLADAVGLGKTRMALGVIHHVVYGSTEPKRSRRRPVLLVVPASLHGMWQKELERFGLDWACDVVNLQALSEQLDATGLSDHDLVVIDEAHRLRSGGTWFRKAMEIVSEGIADKMVLLLTATPVHTSITDLTNMLRILAKNQRNIWAPEIADFERYLKMVEEKRAEAFPILDRSVVRRSRSDLLRADAERRAAGATDSPLILPKRKLVHVTYGYGKSGGEELFQRYSELLVGLELAPYDLERFRRDDSRLLAADELPPASSLAGLYLAGVLKRFESSLRAARLSLVRLAVVLERSAKVLSETPPKDIALGAPEVERLIQAERDGDTDTEDLAALWDQVSSRAAPLQNPETYDLPAALQSIERDQQRVKELLESLPREAHDGKVAALVALLTGRLAEHRVLVFSQFRDTARYLFDKLKDNSALGRVVEIDGSVAGPDRERITRWFDPDAPTGDQVMQGDQEPRILVSTDVLAEGHNLQRASAVVNFDLHWNPQVIVQRAGRVDRLNSPYAEIGIYSFLPEEGLEAHLGLIRRLNERFRLIHFLGLGDEPTTRLSGDIPGTTFEQLQRIYRDDASILEAFDRAFLMGSTDYMRQPLEAFLRQAGREALREIPVGVQSVKSAPRDWSFGAGTFVAFRHGKTGIGETHWRFYPDSGGPTLQNEEQIFRAILCGRSEPRIHLEDDRWPLIDWALLKRAAEEITLAMNQRRATAGILRGASERSRKIREALLVASQGIAYASPDLDTLLDRLEDVRVEDVDFKPEYRGFRDWLHRAGSTDEKDRAGALARAVSLGLELFGATTTAVVDAGDIRAADLTLVAWERIVATGAASEPAAKQVGLF